MEDAPAKKLERPKRFRSKHFIAAVAGAALVGVALAGPGMIESNSRGHDSLIVAGVPGQVETFHSDDELISVMPRYSTYRYWIVIEQCPQDIDSAEKGHPTESFDPRVGEIRDGCNLDWVLVDAGTYLQTDLGDTVTFSGRIATPLKK